MRTLHQAEKARTIPRPRAPIDPRKEPFVGNATTDDNLAEAIEVAIWTVAGESGRRIETTVNDGIVKLTGTLESMANCKAIAQGLNGAV